MDFRCSARALTVAFSYYPKWPLWDSHPQPAAHKRLKASLKRLTFVSTGCISNKNTDCKLTVWLRVNNSWHTCDVLAEFVWLLACLSSWNCACFSFSISASASLYLANSLENFNLLLAGRLSVTMFYIRFNHLPSKSKIIFILGNTCQLQHLPAWSKFQLI